MLHNTLKRLRHHHLIISLLGHVIVLICLVCIISKNKDSELSLSQVNILPAYLLQSLAVTHSPALIRQSEPQKKILKAQRVKSKADITLRPQKINLTTQSKNTKQRATAAQNTLNAKPVSELLAMLHTSIEQQQHYPADALELQREGRITLAFTLNTDGTINHLRVLKSSDTSSLDEAALAAVTAAAPFTGVAKYIQQAQDYQIDVVFVLT